MQISSGPIGILDKHKPVHIFGAGISGLVLAYYLKKFGHEVTIFEKQNKVGGKISTHQTNFGPAEKGANAIFANTLARELVEELGLDYLTATKKLKKKIFKDNSVTSKPLKIKDILKIIFSLGKKPPFIDEKTTVQDFFTPLIGREMILDFLDAAFAGIYAIPAKELQFTSVFKKSGQYQSYFRFFLDLKKSRDKAESISFDEGMGEFIHALRDKLKDNIKMSTEISTIDDKYNNIICTEAHNASLILAKSHQKLADYLKEIPYVDLQTTTLFTGLEIEELKESFGVVFSPKNHSWLKGILNNKAIFEKRSSADNIYSYTIISKKLENPSSELEIELKKVFSIDLSLEIKDFRTTYWDKAIPSYNVKRAELVGKLRSEIFSYPPGLIIFGNYVDGISIREMIAHAKFFAKQYKKTREE